MKRRQFLGHAAGTCVSFALAPLLSACASAPPRPADPPEVEGALDGLPIVDAHAHPDQFHSGSSKSSDASSSVDSLTRVGACASAFAAVGDLGYLESRGAGGLAEYTGTVSQLARLKAVAASGRIRPVTRVEEIPGVAVPGRTPGALFAVEGGDALCGQVEFVGELYRRGVRMLSLVHYRNNELADVMVARPGLLPGYPNGGITPAGRGVLERMEALGMVVDVAHLSAQCLKEAVDACTKPLVDSHTSPRPEVKAENLGRLRTWAEMEWIAGTGGVVCTWPYAYEVKGAIRRSFRDWAAEIAQMMRHLGTEHVGLGTDGGGNLPARIDGYADVRDLGRLATAMREEGLSEGQLAAYFGGNFLRVLGACLREAPA